MARFSFAKAPAISKENEDLQALVAWLEDSFRDLQNDLQSTDVVELGLSYNAPTRPQTGNVVYADGTKWNPGSGERLYVRSSSGLWLPIADAAAVQVGQCKFKYVDATHVRLDPFDGNKLRIQGQLCEIPAAGVAITNSGLGNSTLYYCYAYMSSGTIALEFSTTTHATDTTAGNVGVEVKSGDPTRSLVGMVYTTSAGQFSDVNYDRRVRSWFNDFGHRGYNNYGTSTNFTNTAAFAEPDTNCRVVVLGWAGEQVVATSAVYASNNTNTAATYLQNYVVGIGTLGLYVGFTTAAAGQASCLSVPASTSYSVDGIYTFTVALLVSAGTGTAYTRNLNIHTIRK